MRDRLGWAKYILQRNKLHRSEVFPASSLVMKFRHDWMVNIISVLIRRIDEE